MFGVLHNVTLCQFRDFEPRSSLLVITDPCPAWFDGAVTALSLPTTHSPDIRTNERDLITTKHQAALTYPSTIAFTLEHQAYSLLYILKQGSS